MASLKLTRNIHKAKRVVGLDIEASSIAATELQLNGGVRVGGYGIEPLEAGVFREGEVQDPEELAEALKRLFANVKLPREVRLGVANQRVVVRTLRVPHIDNPDELETAIRFQAQDHIPMPLDQAVLDWQVVPPQPGAEASDLEVVVVAARRDMLKRAMDAVHGAGLRLVGIDHSAFGLIRALSREAPGALVSGGFVDPGETFDPMADAQPTAVAADAAPDHAPALQEPALQEPVPSPQVPADPQLGVPPAGRVYCNLGDVSNLAVTRGDVCVFTRAINYGVEGMAQSLAERAGLVLDHARRWLAYVGLQTPVEAIEGDPEIVAKTREALATGTAKLGDELRRSLEYYAALDEAVRVESMVVAGGGTTIPGLVDALRGELPLPVGAVTPGALSGVAGADAARLTLSYGLGLEE
jgi:type IV pilus assembly protein PilM